MDLYERLAILLTAFGLLVTIIRLLTDKDKKWLCYILNALLVGIFVAVTIIILVVINPEEGGGKDGPRATETQDAEPSESEVTISTTNDPTEYHDTIIPVDIDIGDTFSFGVYEQDGNSSNRQEPIEWVVLDKADGKVLVLSTEALDCKPYNNQDSGCTWATCSLRKWLNGTFYKAAFSNKERERIMDTIVEAHANPDFSTNPGMSTHDYIFLLSVEEVNQYLPYDSNRMCFPTEYAKVQGGFENKPLGTCWWWLRTPGETSSDACSINSDGTIDTDNGTVSSNKGCVRPAMWLSIGE